MQSEFRECCAAARVVRRGQVHHESGAQSDEQQDLRLRHREAVQVCVSEERAEEGYRFLQLLPACYVEYHYAEFILIVKESSICIYVGIYINF